MGDNNIQEFDVGQKVLIVGAGEHQDEFERWVYFCRPHMSDHIGEIATISQKRKVAGYSGRLTYNLEEIGCVWADKWLAPLYNTNDFIYS